VYCETCCVPTESVETLADMRRAERKQQEQAERAEAARQASAAKDAANDAAIREERQRYIQFARAQLNANVPLKDLVSFERWCACSEGWRLDVLLRIGA
jgi:hypothetical protein